MQDEASKTTVYFDGSCPLCRTEIGYYQRQDAKGSLCFVDVSAAGATTPPGVSQQQAMARFHVRAADGQVLSGAAGFVEVWRGLPGWQRLARLVRATPGALALMELGYRAFLPVRPLLSRITGALIARRAARSSATPPAR